MNVRMLLAVLVSVFAVSAHAEDDDFTKAVNAVQLPPGFSQSCFSQPRSLDVVKASLVLETMIYGQQGATRQQVLEAVLQSKHKALVIGTNTAAICSYAIGNGHKNNMGRAPMGFCELGIYIDDCSAIEQILPALEQMGVRIDRVNKKIPQNIEKLAPGVGV